MDVPSCPGCRELAAEVERLREELRPLKALLQRNASNSSLPPSANPSAAPPPVTKLKTGRRPGGQPGHPPHLRQLLPPERISRTVTFVPTHCRRCQTPLPAQPGPGDPAPSHSQVAELPPVRAEVTEYQGHGRRCPGCGEVTSQPVPAELTRCSVGLGLAAAMGYLAGAHQVSKRGVEEIVEALFDGPVALGVVANREQELSAALAAAHAEAVATVRTAPVIDADETGWKRRGVRCWLWVAATTAVAAFVLHARRSRDGLAALVGQPAAGVVVSDRWGVYQQLPLYQRQVCWAHLRRDVQGLIDLGSAAKAFGLELALFAEDIFTLWYRVRDGSLARSSLQTYVNEQRPWLRDLLRRGSDCGCAKAAALCANLLALEPALWTFVRRAGVEPTNNHAERVLRRAVLWRKKPFGCASEGGCRFLERVLTAVQTLRLQGRPVWQFLRQPIAAYRAYQPAPSLLAG